MVIWLIGLSKSGKTTIAKKLIKSLKSKKKVNFFHLDGDVMRKIYSDKLGHTIKDRKINAMRISKLCKLLSDQGVNVVASVLSNFPVWQKWNKKNIKNYKQAFFYKSHAIPSSNFVLQFLKPSYELLQVKCRVNDPEECV